MAEDNILIKVTIPLPYSDFEHDTFQGVGIPWCILFCYNDDSNERSEAKINRTGDFIRLVIFPAIKAILGI